jgi:hypothetical protein
MVKIVQSGFQSIKNGRLLPMMKIGDLESQQYRKKARCER